MKIGFIGCGNMGEAMLQGILRANYADPKQIIVHTNTQKKMKYLADQYEVSIASSNQQVVEEAAIVILAIKPNLYAAILKEITPYLQKNTVLVSITPAFTLHALNTATNDRAMLVRAMPNTPATIGLAMSGLCFDAKIQAKQKKEVHALFSSFGKVLEVEESQMKMVGTLSGSSPAFIFYFMQAFVDRGVALGMDEQSARYLIGQTMIGSATFALASTQDFTTLITQVCSPKGSTIEGINHLHQQKFYQILQEALLKTTNRFVEMSENSESL